MGETTTIYFWTEHAVGITRGMLRRLIAYAKKQGATVSLDTTIVAYAIRYEDVLSRSKQRIVIRAIGRICDGVTLHFTTETKYH